MFAAITASADAGIEKKGPMPLQDKKLAGTAQVHFSVTDGRVALDINGAVVGQYPTLRQAVRAFENGGVR